MRCSSGSIGNPNNLVAEAITGSRRPTAASANTAEAGETFDSLGGSRGAFRRVCHLGCDLLGPGGIPRGENGTQVFDK